MRKTIQSLCAAAALSLAGGFTACDPSEQALVPVAQNSLRAPAYPLVTIDPYTSAWSFSDRLMDDPVRHWTGKPHPLIGALRVDGEVYRFLGTEEMPLRVILPMAVTEKWEAAYTEQAPAKTWSTPAFNDAAWQRGKAAFGTADMPGRSTAWESSDIWVRRTFELTEDLSASAEPVYLEYSHDDDFTLYINGVEVVNTGYAWATNVLKELPAEAKATLKPGKNVIAAHGTNRVGGALVDFGLSVKDAFDCSFGKAAQQLSATVMPTSTYYAFACGPVQLHVAFTAPLLLEELDLVSTPVNYITYQVVPTDGQAHDVQIYVEASPLWSVNTAGQPVDNSRESLNGISYLRSASREQAILGKKGDDVRIDWGAFYLASKEGENLSMHVGEYHEVKQAFVAKGVADPDRAAAPDAHASLAYSKDLGRVSDATSDYLMIGYDDIFSIQYFHENRPAYWKHDGNVDIYQAFERAAQQYDGLMQRCRQFDAQLMADAVAAGGQEYAELCALVYRQAIAAHKLITDREGALVFLSKENFSNGSVGTVDLTYPSAPLFLLYNPELLKGMMNPIFYFSESGKWDKPFAAHDVGTYPLANGQTYGGDMPIEESGNMLVLATAIAVVEGNADYAKKHWDVLTTWANYLLDNGLDPANQLCTDDFAGHFAHNANLSIKAIMGIAGYGKLAGMLGDAATAEKYTQAAREMAAKWMTMADAGDHYRLTFDRPDSWSQKYNLVWDRLLGLSIFPQEVAEKEMAFYLKHQNKYGLPLDSRKTYTKSDWILWSACLTGDAEQFKQLIAPVHKYADETTTRMPMSDWYETTDGKSVNFRARSVVGAYFLKMLEYKRLGR